MGLRLLNLINKNTKQNVCPQYNNREVDITKSIIEIGKTLKITNLTGIFFHHHEKVINIEYSGDTMYVETTRKIWQFEMYKSCNYCGGEMALLEKDDILGYRQWWCLNVDCQATCTRQGEQYDEDEWEEGDLDIEYKPTTAFYELYKQGKVFEIDIHDYIDIWHNREIDDNISLHEFLGMSWEQYSLWVNKDEIWK